MDVCDRFYVEKRKLPLLYAGMRLGQARRGNGLPQWTPWLTRRLGSRDELRLINLRRARLDAPMARRNNNVRGPTSALTEFLRVRPPSKRNSRF